MSSAPCSALPEPDLACRTSATTVANHPSWHCGTGIVPDRDITGSWRDVDEPCASLPAAPPGRARARRGNWRLFDTGRRNPARDGLSAGGQVSHGKSAPLRRIAPGDRVVFYSPTDAFRGKDKLQSLTAIGVVKEGRSLSSRHGRRILPIPAGCHLASGCGDTDPDTSRAAGVHERQQELGLSTPLRLAEISELDTAAGLYRCSLWSWGPRFS